MTTVQTRLQFNVRKKRLHSSKFNAEKENANCGNRKSSALNASHEHGRKFNENKCQSKFKEFLPKQILLLDDDSDSDSDAEGNAVRQHVNIAVGKKSFQCTENLQVVDINDELLGSYIPFLRIHMIFILCK
jgi:hypothetical protein